MTVRVLLFFVLLSCSLVAFPQDKHWGVRTGGNWSRTFVESGEHHVGDGYGFRVGAIYQEDFTASGFDFDLYFAKRKAELAHIILDESRLGFAGRFRGYFSTKRRFSVHLGYQLNLKLAGKEEIDELLMGPELGIGIRIGKRLAIEGSVFFPVQRSGTYEWTVEETIDEQPTEVTHEEAFYIFTTFVSVSYRLFERF